MQSIDVGKTFLNSSSSKILTISNVQALRDSWLAGMTNYQQSHYGDSLRCLSLKTELPAITGTQ